MKNTTKYFLLILAFCFFFTSSIAGTLDSTRTKITFIRSVLISTPTKVSVDIYENLYTSDNRGNVLKFDSSGKFLFQYSPSRRGDVSALEARRNVNIFLFNKNLQEYYFLDRFLARNNTSKFSQDIGFARAATISSDNNIWVIDEIDFSLKKYGIHKQLTTLKTPLDLLLDPKLYQINYLIEYQNLLFVNDENSGLLIFDNLGNFKNRTDIKEVKYFNFLGDNLYYIKDDTLFFYDIYKSLLVRSIVLPASNFQFALCGEKKMYLFAEDRMDIYLIE